MASTPIIPLDTEQGQQMLKEVLDNGWPDQPWVRRLYAKQIGRSNCGIQSCAIIMSAGVLGKKVKNCPESLEGVDVPFKEKQMFDFEATTKVADAAKVDKDGLTFEQVANILHNHEYGIEEVYASSSAVDEFRERVIEALSHKDSEKTVIVNYLMSYFGHPFTYGHHSPLAAYHKDSDSFLLMDVWPATPVCWAKTEDLFKAMDTIDSDSNKCRGFLIVTYLS